MITTDRAARPELGPAHAPGYEPGHELAHAPGPRPGHAPAHAEGASPTVGVVRETMNAGGYTYLRIEPSDGAPVWVAAIEMPLEVGDEVRIEGGNEMVDFHSRTLDRTFDRIVFAGSVRVVGEDVGAATAPELPPGHPPTGGAPSEVATAVDHAAAGQGVRGVVRETMNASSYTYLRLEGPGVPGGSVWVAVPEMTVAVGDEVEATPGSEMPGFHSRTLDRTFEQITFSPGARVVTPAAGR